MPRHHLIFCLALMFCLTVRGRAQPNVTTYARMTAQLQADSAHCSLLRLTSLGKAASGRKDLWLVRVADPSADSAQNIRILILCRQHGDEPASTEAMLTLLHQVATGGDTLLRQTLSHVTLYIIPMVNPDGADVNSRANAAGADLNRDWGVFRQPETRAVARAARLLRPNLIIDAHNWDGSDEYNADCLEVPRDMTTPQGKAAHVLQQQAMRELAADGYLLHPTAWGADSDPRLAHRWFSNQNILSVLVETHSGEPTDVSDFQRREGMYTALVHCLARRYAAAYSLQDLQLKSWEGDVNGGMNEAALFPPPALVKASLPPFARRPAPRFWLWALCAYGLALWGAGRKPTRLTSSPPSRNGREKRSAGIGRGVTPSIEMGGFLRGLTRYSLPRKRSAATKK